MFDEGAPLPFGIYQSVNYPTVNFLVGLGAECAVAQQLSTAPETYVGDCSEVLGGSFFWRTLIPVGLIGEIATAPPIAWEPTGADNGEDPMTWPDSRLITASGPVIVGPTDFILLIDKTAGAATPILLPPAASRKGRSIEVKDLKGDASVNNITFVPATGETIDGFSATAAIANGVALIDTNYGAKKLKPLLGGGWYVA